MADRRPTVQIKPGLVAGLKTTLPNGKVCYQYKGIPYAESPVGSLRFKPPVPLEEFRSYPLDCTMDKNVSLSNSYIPPDSQASEDCLFLNVFTPTAPGRQLGDLLPVMVWIHGGAFCSGSGDSSIYNPEYLVQEGVIVVTLNYRLGPLGFLCLPSVEIYGNMGLKDQRLALKWVHDNIRNFGGDPRNVTLFGESAGGCSVHFHCLDEESAKYFHKAICQSGVATSSTVLQADPEVKARRLAQFLGCRGNTDMEIHDFLLYISAEEIAFKQKGALTEHEQTLDSYYPFKPVIEVPNSDQPIITENILDALKQPNRVLVPMIIGITNEEAIYKGNSLINYMERYSSEPCRFIPNSLDVPKNLKPSVANNIVQFYCETSKPTAHKVLGLTRIFSDNLYIIPTLLALELHHVFQPSAPVYFYQFAMETELNKFRQLWNVLDSLRGACHADDIYYLFSSSYFYTKAIKDGSKADQMRKLMCKLWTNFAKTSDPTPEGFVGGFRWEPYRSSSSLNCLQLAEQVRMVDNPYNERLLFWKQLYNRYNRSFLRPKLMSVVEVITQLAAGKIRGRKLRLPNGDCYCSYKGIPYAQPPVGALRFKTPVALEKLDVDVVLDCSYERSSCYALLPCPATVAVSEDCLYANVYTPLNPTDVGRQKYLPVMVWVHGGAFGAGSGEYSMYNPCHLLQQDVIVVTFNYRLGPFGFLCFPPAKIYGNMGLKDQRMLLRWVHLNISRFGGDPSNVTVFGESAGGASVHLLYLSETCRQYFHKAICQSGVAVSCWVQQRACEANAINLAKSLGCVSESSNDVYDTLMKASGHDLLMHSDENLMTWDEKGPRFYTFTPVVESKNSDEPFLTEQFCDILRKPNMTTIPLMLGVTNKEGKSFAPYLWTMSDLFSSDLERYVPPQLSVPVDQRRTVGEEVKRFYLGERNVSPEAMSSILDYISDCMFVIPAIVVSELHSRYQHRAPQFFYRFAFTGELNLFTSPANSVADMPFSVDVDGAAHGDDLPYLFENEYFGASGPGSINANKFRLIIIQLWTNFAKFGNPTPTKEQIGCIWDKVTPIDEKQQDFPLHVLDLADPIGMASNPFADRVDFWKKLFSKFGGNYLNHYIEDAVDV
ncbi:uncharacterized protein LOC129719825 [Wyeomyia smithii]|uniref:uncharacterized protein LOC129719825 n=1 Tax=Wyeomyia smithii TaxID=174621 RepID=UPI002467D18A|nr:uncharacterized protein LOC129719825 [Wyeomyia smithii]